MHPRRVQVDVPGDLVAMGLALDKHVAEPAFEHMAPPAVNAVVCLRVAAVQTLKTAAQRLFREANQQMVVRAHERVREALPLAPRDLLPEVGEEELPIRVAAKDRHVVHPVLDAVIDTTDELNPRST